MSSYDPARYGCGTSYDFSTFVTISFLVGNYNSSQSYSLQIFIIIY